MEPLGITAMADDTEPIGALLVETESEAVQPLIMAEGAAIHPAGGRFTDLAGAPFRYDGRELRNLRGILACNAAAYDAVLPACRRAGRTAGLV